MNESTWTSWVQAVVVFMALILIELDPTARANFALLWGTVWLVVTILNEIESRMGGVPQGWRILNTIEWLFGTLMLVLPYITPFIPLPSFYNIKFWLIALDLGGFRAFLYWPIFGLILLIEVIQIIVARVSQPRAPTPPWTRPTEKRPGVYCKEELSEGWADKKQERRSR